MKTVIGSLLSLFILAGCGVDFTKVDFFDIVEPMDDAEAPVVCSSAYFGRIESEVNVDCTKVEENAKLATDYVTRLTLVDQDSYYRIMRRSTIHIMAQTHWQSKTGQGDVNGQAWFQRADVDRGMTSLAHESLHIYDISHWKMDTGNHPGWGEYCPGTAPNDPPGPVTDSSCNYYRADNDYSGWAQYP